MVCSILWGITLWLNEWSLSCEALDPKNGSGPDLFNVHEAPDEGTVEVGHAGLHTELHLATVGFQKIRFEAAHQGSQT